MNAELEVILERHGGLNIAQAKALHDEKEARGEVVDRLGDNLSNNGEYNRRHNGVMYKAQRMVSAVAVGVAAGVATIWNPSFAPKYSK